LKCPKCNKDIDHLTNVVSGTNTYTLDIGGGYDQVGSFDPDYKTNDYHCPECDAVLFTDDKEALKFLNK